jgi:hypothetical protein
MHLSGIIQVSLSGILPHSGKLHGQSGSSNSTIVVTSMRLSTTFENRVLYPMYQSQPHTIDGLNQPLKNKEKLENGPLQ